MSDQYVNNGGQVGNMGEKGKVEGNTFSQNNENSFNSPKLTKNDVKNLKDLLQEIITDTSKNILMSEKLQASAHLSSIVEAAEIGNQSKVDETLNKWRRWIPDASDSIKELLSTASSVVSLGLPLLQALNIISL